MTLNLVGPLTLGPAPGEQGSHPSGGGHPPVAFALPPTLADGHAAAPLSYEAHARGGDNDELEIVARAVRVRMGKGE
jgi:hypothetical protein